MFGLIKRTLFAPIFPRLFPPLSYVGRARPTMSIVTVAAVTAPPTADKQKGRPAHHLDDEGTVFHNPWPSWRRVFLDYVVYEEDLDLFLTIVRNQAI